MSLLPFSNRALEGAVVVITGASSGIGRASAIRFAAAGASVVLAARRDAALAETARACRRKGATAMTVVTDVTREADLERLVKQTLSRFGRIDVWVNNAGTTMFGRLYEGEFRAHRQVLETNLMGPMYTARLLIPLFRRQGRGTMINVGSVLSQIGQSYVPAYAISKFGLRGLSEALRSDVADDRNIHVCTVLPYAVDTPHFEEGANVTGRRAHAMQPVQSPDAIARAIVRVAARPRRERYVPRYVWMGLVLHWLMPRTTERLLRHALKTFHLVGREPHSTGSLFVSRGAPGRTRGTRPPIVSRVGFALWVAMDLARMTLSRGRGFS